MLVKYFGCRVSLVSIVCLALANGCGPAAKPTGSVSGKVTYKGAAVKDAKIQIQSAESGYADAANLDATGKYQFKTPVVAGKYVATIEPIVQMPVAGSTPTPSKPPERPDIPKKYRSGGNSALTLTVTKGKTTTYDLDMTD